MMMKILAYHNNGYYSDSEIEPSDTGKKWFVWHPVYKRITGFYKENGTAYDIDAVINTAIGDPTGVNDDD